MTVSGLGHSGHSGVQAHSEASKGHESSEGIPGLPSIANNSPEEYIKKLLAPIQGEEEPAHGDLFSPLEGEGHGGVHISKEKSKWIKWAVAGLVALGFWRAAANKAASSAVTSTARSIFRRRP